MDYVFKHGPIAITEVPNSMFVIVISQYFIHIVNMQGNLATLVLNTFQLWVFLLPSIHMVNMVKYGHIMTTCMKIEMCYAYLVSGWQWVGCILMVNMRSLGLPVYYGPFGLFFLSFSS